MCVYVCDYVCLLLVGRHYQAFNLFPFIALSPLFADYMVKLFTLADIRQYCVEYYIIVNSKQFLQIQIIRQR